FALRRKPSPTRAPSRSPICRCDGKRQYRKRLQGRVALHGRERVAVFHCGGDGFPEIFLSGGELSARNDGSGRTFVVAEGSWKVRSPRETRRSSQSLGSI